MNFTKVVLTLLGALALAGASRSLYAQQQQGGLSPPTGTYTQSCSGATIFNSFFLSAQCSDEAGNIHQTSLDLRTCAGGSDVGNNNGLLACAPVSTPPGTYQQTCVFASFLGNNSLQALCQDRNGNMDLATLDLGICVAGSDIGNNNGQLQCSTG